VKRWRLSDSDWHTILEAVGPLRKGARLAPARRELAKCLHDYPGLRRDTARLEAVLARWQRIHRLAADLYAAINDEWRRGWTRNALIEDAFQKYLLRSSAVWTTHLATEVRLRKGKLDPDRDRLYQSLLDIWTNQFRGELGASSGATGGPCVRFVRAAMGLVLPADEVPAVSTVRRIVHGLARGEVLGRFRLDRVSAARRRPRVGSIKP
jgi:hypothetical protein